MKQRRLFFSLLSILIAGFLAYHNSFSGVFVFDDLPQIYANPSIRQLWPIWDVLKASSRPLVELSLAMNFALGGTEVFGYHVVNLLIHLCAALILFGIARRTFCTESLRNRYGEASWGLALTIALLWLVHPLQTESVTYIIQRAESLMGLFYLLTLYCVIRGADSSNPRRWHLAAVISCAAGMASKPIMVTAPILVFLYDRTFISGTFRKALLKRKKLYLGLALTWGVLVMLLVVAPADPTAGFRIGILPVSYALTQTGVLLHYFFLSLWPVSLCLDYAWPEIQTLKEIVGPMLAMGVALLLAGWGLYRRWRLAFLGTCFFLILAPTSSFFPLQDFAVEHRMYLPLAAIITLAVLGGRRLLWFFPLKDHLKKIVAITCVVTAIVGLSALTIHRNRDYYTEEAIWRDTIAKRPQNARAHYNLGFYLYQQGRHEEAKTQITQALQLEPGYPEAHHLMGDILDLEGQTEAARAHYRQAELLDINHYREILKVDPNNVEAHNNLAVLLEVLGHSEEAKKHYLRALQLNPNLGSAQSGLNRLRDKAETNQDNTESIK